MTRILPPLSPQQKAAFVDAVRALLSAGKKGGPVRFKHAGRSTKGIDCIGVAVWGYKRIGLGDLISDLDRYSHVPDGGMLRKAIVSHLGQPITYARAEPGDIALMRWFGDQHQWVNHVGVLTSYQFGGLALLHSFIQKPYCRVIEHNLADPKWRNRIVEVYRT